MPDADTVAMLALLDVQTTVRPVSTLLPASRVVAVAWVVCPIASELAARATLTDATGTEVVESATTVKVVLAVLHPRVALIVTVPGATPVTRPEDETVAIELSLDPHVIR